MTIYVSKMVNISAGVSVIGGSGGLEWKVISVNTNAVTKNGYIINTSGGSVTLTLPSAPVAGDIIGIADYNKNFATHNCTIDRNGKNIMGMGENFVCDVNNTNITLIYTDNTLGWKMLSSGNTIDRI